MIITTKFSCKDKVWCLSDKELINLTVGQVRIKYTDSSGLDQEGALVEFDNYKPQKGYEESYMMIETGIDSGNVYTLGQHCFETKSEGLQILSLYKARQS